jgi:DNA polymerase III epsilon subunit-like protein
MWRRLLDLIAAARRPLVVLDFETSGLGGAPPVEYAVAMWAPWQAPVDDDATNSARRTAPPGLTYAATSRLDPGGPIHPDAQRVHGITAEDVRGAMPYNDLGLVSVFRSLAAGDPDAEGGPEGPAIFVGHNAAESDVPWAQTWGYLPRDPAPAVVDTMRLQRRLVKSHPMPLVYDGATPGEHPTTCPAQMHGLEPYATSLVGLHTALFGDPPSESHGAMADVLSTARCLAAMLELWAPLWPGPVALHEQGDHANAAINELLACLDAPPPGLLSWDGWVRVDRDTGAASWGPKARKVGEGAPLTCDRGYADWVIALPPAPTGRNGEAWCSDATREAIMYARANPNQKQGKLL